MQVDAVHEGAVEAGEGGVLGDVLRPALRQRRDPAAVEHVAVGDAQGLAGEHAVDAGEDRCGTRS